MYNKSLEMNFVLESFTYVRIKKIIKIMPFFQPLECHYPLILNNFGNVTSRRCYLEFFKFNFKLLFFIAYSCS